MDTDSITLTFNAAELAPATSADFAVEYEDITSSDEEAPPPSPPRTPHPSVCEKLRHPDPPAAGDWFPFEPTADVDRGTMATASAENEAAVEGLNLTLVRLAADCTTLDGFVRMLRAHLAGVTALLGTNRTSVTRMLRARGFPTGVISRNKYVAFKRVAVWRDTLKVLLEMVTDESAHWKMRKVYWHHLEVAQRASWYCCHILFTLGEE